MVDKLLSMLAQLYNIGHMAAIHMMCTSRINIYGMEKSGKSRYTAVDAHQTISYRGKNVNTMYSMCLRNWQQQKGPDLPTSRISVNPVPYWYLIPCGPLVYILSLIKLSGTQSTHRYNGSSKLDLWIYKLLCTSTGIDISQHFSVYVYLLMRILTLW